MTKPNRTQPLLGQPSWRLASAEVEAWITQTGGQLGPVTFALKQQKVQPFSVAPWAEESLDPTLPALLHALRGDFFCLPFGGNGTPYRGEQHPPHGETANSPWTWIGAGQRNGRHWLQLRLAPRTRPGRVDKRLFLVDGQTAVYSEHTVAEMRGPMCLGHHPMLKFPPAAGSGVISTTPFVKGYVLPVPFEQPEVGGYCTLKSGAEFQTLDQVPRLSGEMTDLSRFPARPGFDDLALLVSDSTAPFAWTAVTFPKERQVWFSLKNPRLLRATVLWISNGGRHYPPWNGRHRGVMGLEEVTAFFHFGLAESARKNFLSEQGIPTVIRLEPDRPLVVPFIQAMSAVPAGFDRVLAIEPAPGGVVLRSASGKAVRLPLSLEFLTESPSW